MEVESPCCGVVEFTIFCVSKISLEMSSKIALTPKSKPTEDNTTKVSGEKAMIKTQIELVRSQERLTMLKTLRTRGLCLPEITRFFRNNNNKRMTNKKRNEWTDKKKKELMDDKVRDAEKHKKVLENRIKLMTMKLQKISERKLIRTMFTAKGRAEKERSRLKKKYYNKIKFIEEKEQKEKDENF